MTGDFHMAQLRHTEIVRLRQMLDTAELEIRRLQALVVEDEREIKALRDELDYVHQERDDLEKQVAEKPTIPWLRKVDDDRWEITDRD